MPSQEKFNSYEYSLQTNDIEISVRPFYADELSSPRQNKYVFIYKIKIRNFSSNAVKLLKRFWNIVDSDGMIYVVEGEGVIGEQPIIKPGQEFEYASQAILFSSSGMMYGKYNFINTNTNDNFDAKIPAFSLDSEDFNESPN